MSDQREAYVGELAKAGDLVRDAGCASEEEIKLGGLQLRSEGDGWWSVHHSSIDDNSLLDVIDATEYRSARKFYEEVCDLVQREAQNSEPDRDDHRYGREVA